MKKLFAAVAAVAAFSAHAGDLSVAATPVPHAEILEFVNTWVQVSASRRLAVTFIESGRLYLREK